MSAKTIVFRKLVVAASAAAVLMGAAGAAYAANRHVLVVNDTNHTLTNLYASSVRDSEYHGDWLGRATLSPGESVVIDFDDGRGTCRMDVKALFSDETNVQQHDFNVCTRTTMRFTGN